jgi:hypothetical protein
VQTLSRVAKSENITLSRRRPSRVGAQSEGDFTLKACAFGDAL